MRELDLNGYIDDEVWFGDEITPDSLHDMLYTPGTDLSEDVHIRLNSYGGSCNAAVRMHDDLVAYPGRVNITISGTAASAATVLAMAADSLEMTPGSLFMIHDPIVAAIGNEADLMEAIQLLQACKESIINVYEKRSLAGRDQIAKMMRETTWMDAQAAQAYGFIDSITSQSPSLTVINCAIARDVAEKKVRLWLERRRTLAFADRRHEESREDAHDEQPKEPQSPPGAVEAAATAEAACPTPAPEAPAETTSNATPISQLRRRLALIMPTEAKHKEETI